MLYIPAKDVTMRNGRNRTRGASFAHARRRRGIDMDTQAGGLMDISKRPWAPLAVDYGIYSPLMAGSIDGTDDRPHDRAVERAMMSSCELLLSSDSLIVETLCRQVQ